MDHNFHLVPLFSGILNLLLAVFVVSINPRRRLNQIFLLLGVGLAWWNFGAFQLSQVHDASDALARVRLTLVGIVFLPVAAFHFAVESTRATNAQIKLIVLYSAAAVFLAFNFTNYFVASVRPFIGVYRATAGPAFWIFYLVFFPVAAYNTWAVLEKSSRAVSRATARSVRFLTLALSLLFLAGFHDMLPVLGHDYYPGTNIRIIAWGTLGASVYGLLIAYGILSDQFLDVRISISRYTATVVRLFFLGGIAYVLMLSAGVLYPATFTSNGLIASLVILLLSAAATAYFFPKLFGGLSSRVEQGVLGDHFEYHDKVAAFIDSPQEMDDVPKLLDQTSRLVFEQLSLSAIGISIIGGDATARGRSSREVEPLRSWQTLFDPESAILNCFKSSGLSCIDLRNDFRPSLCERKARELLEAQSLDLACAIGFEAKAPLGLLVAGPKRDGRALTRLDLELLTKLCRNLASRVERIAVIRNEELRQSNNAKDKFLASINHEIRNPLNGIVGLTRMLKQHGCDPRATFLISTLEACTQQLGTTLDDVLDFTHIESEVVTTTAGEVDLVQLVRSTCASNDVSGERITIGCVPTHPVLVRCDAGKIRQILTNYLANALKYGVPLGAKVSLAVNSSTTGNVHVAITVTSTGPTLSADETAVLFTRLTRGRRARETNAHGTGLGLALCRKMAEAMGGKVGVSSAHGETVFWFNADFPSVEQLSSEDIINLSSVAGRRVLAIEDESYNRLVLGHYLGLLRITPTWAENGQAALAAMHEQVFDVIIMDWLLPDMEGAALLQKMREVRTTLPPVFVVSAYSTTSKRAGCLSAGAVAFISKPIDFEKLRAAFDLCAFDTMTPNIPEPMPIVTRVDLSALFSLGKEAAVIDSFLLDLHEGRSRLGATWRNEPKKAALLAHRLKAQMMLIHAKDGASLLELLEQALTENWSTEDIERLVDRVREELGQILDAVRDRGLLERVGSPAANC